MLGAMREYKVVRKEYDGELETRLKNYVENILPRIRSTYDGYSGFAFLVDITTRVGVELTTLNWTSLIKEVVFEKV